MCECALTNRPTPSGLTRLTCPKAGKCLEKPKFIPRAESLTQRILSFKRAEPEETTQ